jgi:hypothetical protein
MEPNRRTIENKIAELRELIRCTLDRSAHPLMRERLIEEIRKLQLFDGAPHRE